MGNPGPMGAKVGTEGQSKPAAIVHALDRTLIDAYGASSFEDGLRVLALQSRLMVGAHQTAISYIPDGDFNAAVHTHSFSEKYEKYNSYDVMPTGEGIWGVIVKDRVSIRLTQEELVAHPRWTNFSDLKDARGLEHPPMRGWLAVPVLRQNGGFVGVLQASDKCEGEFTDDDLKLFEHIAKLATPTFELQYVNQELQRQIHEQTQTEEALKNAEAHYHSLVETLPLSIWCKDRDGKFTFANQALCRALGTPLRELVGKTDFDIAPEVAEKYRQDDQAVMETRQVKEDIEQHPHPDGKRIYIHTVKAPIYDFKGKVVGTLGAFWDVTDRKLAEERLQETAKELKRSNDELEQFASVASHDLQEPLRKVQAFGDRLKTKCGDALTDDGRDYLERMQSAAGRMRTLINDLLTFSRVTTRAQPFVPVDLNALVRDVLSDLEVRIEQAGASLSVCALPTIEAEPTQMRQLFQNLIGNALKFQRTGVPPQVEIRAIKRTNDCEITIEDNGIGFDPKFGERIFGIFQRLHGRDVYEGTGIGLAVCQKIVLRHGGKIVAHGRPGKGATFVMSLPRRQSTTSSDHA